jgi:putative transposase
MPSYVREIRPGGTLFLTLVTERRAPVFAVESARMALHEAMEACRRHHPFVLDAIAPFAGELGFQP